MTLPKRLSASVSFVGTVSYSIYLLHFWYYGPVAKAVMHYVGPLSFGLSLLFPLLAFVFFLPIAALSYRCIEQPFLKLRTDTQGAALLRHQLITPTFPRRSCRSFRSRSGLSIPPQPRRRKVCWHHPPICRLTFKSPG
ncbi:acyltransferase family protein [Ensifer sesbaniae]|uniref:acyltransferase family protein n=1 Tax=Ensifer sesbaniae TaxID=1214071 RepID=UPI0015698802|nr:acyltransferase [Ensifer sesbaniae]